MTEKIFTINRSMASGKLTDLTNINIAIRDELKAGRPVYATVPTGRFKGSIARLKIGKRTITDIGTLFSEGPSRWSIQMSRDQYWELEVDGSNRTFSIFWFKLFERDWQNRAEVKIYIGRTAGTVLNRVAKETQGTLVDFLGNEVHDGDYVLMYSGPWELKETGAPFRMLRYTGKRSNKQAQFTYVKMDKSVGVLSCEGGQTVRVGLNSKVTQEVSDILFGVRIEVDQNLATAMQMCDHDMSIFPISFHVGLADS